MTARARPKLRVAAGVIRRNDLILVARRAGADPLAGKWEFPGGKIEPGESPEECLQRELAEELGITVRITQFLGSTRHDETKRRIELFFYEGEYVGGEIVLRIHDRIAWVASSDIAQYDLAPADLEFVRTLADLRDSEKTV